MQPIAEFYLQKSDFSPKNKYYYMQPIYKFMPILTQMKHNQTLHLITLYIMRSLTPIA